MKKYILLIFFALILFSLVSFTSAVEFNPSNVSTWDSNNWKKVTSMDQEIRDKTWASAGSEKNDIVKKLATKAGSSGFLGFGAKTEGVTIDSVRGFDDSKLKLYTDETSGKKVIGDGKTYLDLDHLPKDSKSLEYSNGKFILTRKDGSKITLEAGSTDDNGKLTSFKYDDIKKAKGLDSLELKTSKDSEVILTKDGFKIKGSESTQVKIGDMSFERNAGDKSTESSVLVGKDRFVLKNTGFTKDNWVTLKPTTNDFTVNFGSHNNLADYVSFKDTDGKWSYVSFDSQGRINGFSRDGVNDGKWVDITPGKISGDLKKIWDSSGYTMRLVIEDNVYRSGPGDKEYNLDYFKERFYKDSALKAKAQEIGLEQFSSSSKDYLSINGLSFEVGGKGEVTALRELTGIVGIDTKKNPVNFKVKNGDLNLLFDFEGVHYSPGPVAQAFKVDDIHMLYEGKTWGDSYSITGTPHGNKIVSTSDYFVAGREAHVGELGVVTDIHMDIPNSDFSKIKTKIDSKGWGGYYTDYLSEVMKDSAYSLKVDLFAPADLIKDKTFIDPTKFSLSGEALAKLADTMIMPNLEKSLTALVIPMDTPHGNVDMKLETETIADIKDIVKTALSNTKEVKFGANYNSGKFTVGFQNNPGGDPSLLLGLPGGEVKNIPLKDTPNGPQTATFVKTILEASIRAPVSERGGISDYSYSSFGDGPNQYWPRDYLRTLWYEKLGKGSDEWDKLLGKNDATFFRGENGVINTYLKKTRETMIIKK